jgi:N-acetylglucosaminyldiphosphoundecaprenol N-acetyl-beta-D-mannosaminyltransferase
MEVLAMATALPDACERIDFLEGRIDLTTCAAVLARVERCLQQRRAIEITAMNVAKLVALRRDPELRRAILASDLIIVDGMGILFGARLLGHRVPERIAGIDLFQALLPLCARRGYPIFLLGARPSVLRSALATLRQRHPQLVIAGARHGYFGKEDSGAIVGEINRSGAACLFIAMPSPAKERFLARHRQDLAVSLRMGIGGTLDVVAGRLPRAPAPLQAAGLEWLWRSAFEPRRLLWRYLRTNTVYAGLLARARIARPAG